MVANSQDIVFGLIDQIYSAAIDDGGWDPLLRRLAVLTDSVAAGITLEHPHTRQGRPITYFGFDASHVEKTFDHYLPMNPLFGIAPRMKTGFIVANGDVVPTPQFQRTEFYNGWARPQGLCSPLTLILDHGEDHYCPLTLVRPDGKGEASEADRELLLWLSPHLTRAMKTHLKLESAQLRLGAAESLLDAAKMATFTLDWRGMVTYANQQARTMLASENVLRAPRNQLQAVDHANSIILQHALTKALKREQPVGAECELKRVNKPPLSVTMMPIAGKSTQFVGVSHVQASCVVIVSDPEMQRSSSIEGGAQAYGLTKAEARVLSIILEGHGVAYTAEALGLSSSTIKTHLQRVFAKTGTFRQAELIRLFVG